MPKTRQIQELSDFLLEYATTLMGAGVHTNRAAHNISRIAKAFGYEANMVIFQRNITMNLTCLDDETLRRTTVRKQKPLAFNLYLIQKLGELSWRPVDSEVSLEEMQNKFRDIMAHKPFPRWLVLLIGSIGSGMICPLFGGDMWAMFIVFLASLVGLFIKQQLSRIRFNPHGTVIITAFVTGMIASVCSIFHLSNTPEVSLATCVLYLVPGMQMISSVMDLLHGHVLMGVSRGIQCLITIICIALGLSATMVIIGVSGL